MRRRGNGSPGPPPPPGQRGASPIYSSVRNFKISENQSPRPQDRVFFDFNYYNNLNNTINLRDLSPITQMKAYIYTFGLEKTFNNGMGSIGIRLPLDNLTANSFGNVISTPTSTSLGNLTVFAKYILAQNPRTGSLVSALFAITPETGPGRFAGALISSRSTAPTSSRASATSTTTTAGISRDSAGSASRPTPTKSP